ncbi:element excision factor XisH family protein [Nostoc sp. UIC 10607]|uniref:element excision factor XisH family protein n=1 Tax=Nostoc sp. UIC 10607 TaxID=3045935 RepID=UPI0039A01B0A
MRKHTLQTSHFGLIGKVRLLFLKQKTICRLNEVYRSVLKELQPKRQLYLAVPKRVYEGIFSERFGQLILNSIGINLIVFDEQLERIIRWIS